MRKYLMVLSACVLLITMPTGCMEKQGDLGNKNIRTNKVRYDANGNLLRDKRFADDQSNEMNRMNGIRLNSNNVIGSHKNYRLEMSEKMAKALTELDEIKSAYVMLTNHNAYVAVSLDENKQSGNAAMMSRTNTGFSGEKGIEINRRMSSLSTGQDRLTKQIEDKVIYEIKRMRPSVERVYVSASPDFVGRMNAYMNDVKLGYPIQGYISEFNAMVERIFPAKATDKTMKSASIKDKRMIYD
ncbi:YhcN/YlaJ family sporulation lipoprotein [Paenibacillus sp. sgz302251]|uniref:YhcN/YlaJ family sporulation lipoprotein n=1 Tax=Paenibacillus sp. sgz302251 TaxID=3414493 RepID=UPI003C79D681